MGEWVLGDRCWVLGDRLMGSGLWVIGLRIVSYWRCPTGRQLGSGLSNLIIDVNWLSD